MASYAVVKTGGKQYVVQTDDMIMVDRLPGKEEEIIELEALARFDDEGTHVELGTPKLTKGVSAKIVKHIKGDKLRIAKFKSKVRQRTVTGFRAYLTQLHITNIA